MRISDWSSDVCSSDLPTATTSARSSSSGRSKLPLPRATGNRWSRATPPQPKRRTPRSFLNFRRRKGVHLILLTGYQMLNTLDLFAGIGGFALGLERPGGIRVAAFCEVDPDPTRNLKKNWRLEEHTLEHQTQMST